MGHVLTLIDPSKALDWVHPIERHPDAKETRMVFEISPLSEADSRALGAANPTTFSRSDGFTLSRDALMIEMFLRCVKRIRNVLMPGETVRRTIESADERKRFLECLPAQFAAPIYEAIQNTGELEAGQEKNFEGLYDSGSSAPKPNHDSDGTVRAESTENA
jgi:hypothetical protein